MALQTLWQIMVALPNPDRLATGKDGDGNVVYSGAAAIIAPWDGTAVVGDAIDGALGALRTAHPDKTFSSVAIGTREVAEA